MCLFNLFDCTCKPFVVTCEVLASFCLVQARRIQALAACCSKHWQSLEPQTSSSIIFSGAVKSLDCWAFSWIDKHPIWCFIEPSQCPTTIGNTLTFVFHVDQPFSNVNHGFSPHQFIFLGWIIEQGWLDHCHFVATFFASIFSNWLGHLVAPVSLLAHLGNGTLWGINCFHSCIHHHGGAVFDSAFVLIDKHCCNRRHCEWCTGQAKSMTIFHVCCHCCYPLWGPNLALIVLVIAFWAFCAALCNPSIQEVFCHLGFHVASSLPALLPARTPFDCCCYCQWMLAIVIAATAPCLALLQPTKSTTGCSAVLVVLSNCGEGHSFKMKAVAIFDRFFLLSRCSKTEL